MDRTGSVHQVIRRRGEDSSNDINTDWDPPVQVIKSTRGRVALPMRRKVSYLNESWAEQVFEQGLQRPISLDYTSVNRTHALIPATAAPKWGRTVERTFLISRLMENCVSM